MNLFSLFSDISILTYFHFLPYFALYRSFSTKNISQKP
nr:MAG TPA: hypothetical protein [Bacteriophage sp.]